MKKFLLIIGFTFFTINLFSQNNPPIIGYDKVQWGSSIQTVTQAYPTVREETSSDAKIGIREFSQSNVGNGIDTRIFQFFNNKLYKVSVFYEEQRDPMSAFLALAERLVGVYGKFDYQDTSQKPSGNNVLKFVDFIRYHNKNLTIFLRGVDVVNQYNNIIENSLLVMYSNPITENEIEEAKRKEIVNTFGL